MTQHPLAHADSWQQHPRGYTPASSKSSDANPRAPAHALAAGNAAPEGFPYAAVPLAAGCSPGARCSSPPGSLWKKSQESAQWHGPTLATRTPHHPSLLSLPVTTAAPRPSPSASAVTGAACWATICSLRSPQSQGDFPENQNTPESKDKYCNLPLPPAQGTKTWFTLNQRTSGGRLRLPIWTLMAFL